MTAGKEEGASGDNRTEAPSYYGSFQDQPSYPQPVPPGGHSKRNEEGAPTYYGTFQDQANYPQPVPPSQQPHYAYTPPHHGYQVQGHPRVVEGRPSSGDYGDFRGESPLPFCGLGFGWTLFILGFFLLVPWYIGAFIYCCLRHDYRERPGLLACVIVAVIFIFFGPGIAKGFNAW